MNRLQAELETLRQAIALGEKSSSSEQVKQLLSRHPKLVDAVDEKGEGPIFMAIKFHNLSGIELLVDAGAALDVPDGAGEYPFHVAVKYGFRDALSRLKQLGADINQPRRGDQLTPLMLAAICLDPRTTQSLLLHGADPSVRDARGKRIVELLGDPLLNREMFDYVQRLKEIERSTGTKLLNSKSSQENGDEVIRLIETNPNYQLPDVVEPNSTLSLGTYRRFKLAVLSSFMMVFGLYQAFYGFIPDIPLRIIGALFAGLGFWFLVVALGKRT